jgi:hypothetical protein
MKNEKFCFSKGTGLIALVGIVLVAAALLMGSLAGKSTSTSTRASVRCTQDQCTGLNRCYEVGAYENRGDNTFRTCCPARTNPDYDDAKRLATDWATWSVKGHEACKVLTGGVTSTKPVEALPTSLSTKCELKQMFLFVPLAADLGGNLKGEFGIGTRIAFDGIGVNAQGKVAPQKGYFSVIMKAKINGTSEITNACTVSGINLPGVGTITLNPSNDFGDNAGFAKLMMFLLGESSGFAYSDYATKVYNVKIIYTSGKTAEAALTVTTSKSSGFTGYVNVDQGMTALQSITLFNPYNNGTIGTFTKKYVLALMQTMSQAVPLPSGATSFLLPPLEKVSVYGKLGTINSTIAYAEDLNPMTYGDVTNVMIGATSPINVTLNPKAANKDSVSLDTIFNGAGGKGNYILDAIDKYGKSNVDTMGNVKITVPARLKFTDGHERKATLTIVFTADK